MKISKLRLSALVLSVALAAGLGRAEAATCGKDPAQFGAWLQDFKAEAVSSGISRSVVDQALAGVTYDPRVIKLDRNQKHFAQPSGQRTRVSGRPLRCGSIQSEIDS